MATFLYRLGRTAYRRWPLVFVGWLVVILGVGGFAAAKSQPMSTTFSIPGVPSLQAADTQAELFPGQLPADKQVAGQIVVQAPPGRTLAEQPYKGQVDRLVAAVQQAPQLPPGTRLANPVVAAPALEKQLVGAAQQQGLPAAAARANAAYISPLSKDGRIGTISWNFAVTNPMEVKPETQDYIRKAAADAQRGGLTVVTGGQGMQEAINPGSTAEAIGILVALFVLVLTFGSLVAAGMPILNAVVGVGLGTLGVTAATAFFDIPDTATALSSMLGLAVGIDYSLFILSRYRAELRHTGDRAHAMGRALGTAGSAVVFAGLTVVIALVAFALLGIPMLTSMGIAAAATVVFAVLVALTLLPAFMGLLKGKAFAGRVRKDTAADESDHASVNGSVRLGNGIRRAPALVALAVVAILGALAIPVTGMHLGLPSDATAAVGSEARTSADLLAEGFGPGKNAPMVAVVDGRQVTGGAQQHLAAYGRVVQWAAKDPNVANAQIVQVNRDSTGAVVLITPKTGPADKATDDLLQRLRGSQPAVEASSGAKVGVTGQTAIAADVSDKLNAALAPYLAIVVGLAFLLLVIVFRSLLVPLLATVGFLLSVLGALGVTAKLVQDGMFGIFDPQPVMSFLPTLMIGIVFGLAMDYQVFLTTRMREAHVHGMGARDAVIDGFRHSGRVVIAAALIMISVFAAFATQDNALIKSLGVALATAIVLDAFLVRMLLVPAVMLMVGDAAWWMPRWLDRLLPTVDVEGESLTRGAVSEPALA
ncbi:MMPL family transporter [Calidifontibacter sp. DB0510]|uniref:MMPL family transporter n=1 Tax=Metallococcus carri TaxID=1656884 RepID=A0A967AY07_9MICO|nr:MMPL family transporter [Metallococcus carri]NHN55071.1 MMPL family transporter [Metallococcus carri]NOP36148.1 MMPL family transporter [Calidifontibacter sp. DB2511S]